MTGGNAVANVIAQSISQPPLKFFHFSATGCIHAKILSLKMRKSMDRMIIITPATKDNALCHIVIPSAIFNAFRHARSALLMVWSTKLEPRPRKDELFLERERLDLRRVHGASVFWWDRPGDLGGDTGRASALAVES